MSASLQCPLTPGIGGGVGVAHLEELCGRPDVEEEEEGERQHRGEERVQTHVVNPEFVSFVAKRIRQRFPKVRVAIRCLEGG